MDTGEVTYKEVGGERWRPGDGPDSVPESWLPPAGQTDVDRTEREDEAPGTAGAGPGRLHGAGTQLAVAGQQLQAGGVRPGPGQGGRVETAVREVALVAGTDPQRVEGLVLAAAHLAGGGQLRLHLHRENNF